LLDKNQVYQKKAKNKKEFEQELFVYQKNLEILPNLIDAKYPYLFIQFLDAVPIGEMKQPDFTKIAELYKILHTETQQGDKSICQIDCNPKNILVEEKTKRYYLIDFAESRLAYPETDLLIFLLFWASILPHSVFKDCSLEFWQAYQPEKKIKRCKKLILELEEKFDYRRIKYCKKERSLSNAQEKNRMFIRKLFC
jgi:hypothetical protein